MKARLFIVEDEPFYAAKLKIQLAELGYDVPAVAESGEAAEAIASTTPFDLAIVDLRLKDDMDGIELSQRLVRRFGLPSILMTGAPDQALIERALASRPYGYMTKPLGDQMLRVTIETALQRHQTEIDLRRREKQLDDVLRTSMDGFLVLSIDGVILDMNDAACVTTGYHRDELLGKSLFDIEVDRTPEQIRAGINTVLQTGSVRIERQIKRKDGAIRFVEMSITSSLPPEQCLYCFGRDITERREADLQLNLLNRAVEQSPASIVITDTQGTIEYVNPYFEKYSGYSRDEAIGQNPRILKSSEHTSEFFQHLWKTISSGNEWRGELCNRRKDGRLFWEQASISPVRDDSGAITHYVAVKENITDRKAAEHTIAWQAALFQNSADICCVKDLDLRIVAANQAMARSAGVKSPAELIGKTDSDLYCTPHDREAALGYMADDRTVQGFKPGQHLERQEKLYLPDGSEHTLLTRKFPVFDRNGYLIGTANISTDITASKHAEAELIRAKEDAEAANRAKSTFLATMSHELRTPLNVINGMASVLAHGDWPPEHRHAIKLITEGGNTLLNIIEEILDYSSLQAGRTRLDQMPFSPAHVTCSALRLFSASMQSKGLDVSCSIDPRTPHELLGDPRRLQQILINLIHNAVKFTEHGRVHVSLKLAGSDPQGCSLVFSVFDTGIGISRQDLQKLFQPFTQADDTFTRRFGGTGLGLVISRSFVKLMGGEISVRSRPGRGSVFRFQIKLAATANRLPSFSKLAQPALRGRRVLVEPGRGAQHRMLLSLLRAWDMLPAPPEGPGAAERPCDVAILQRLPGAATCPVVLFGRDAVHQDRPAAAPARLGLFLDPFELAPALLSLLAQQPGTATPSAPTPTPAPPPPLSILAAEDNRTNREVLKLILSHLGYEADLVVNGAEAVEAVQRKRYDLLLLDIQMPVMDGLTAAEEICRLFPDPAKRLRIVALTANALPGDRERCLAAGMDDYLSKPIVPADLKNCILKLFQGTVHASRPAPTSTTRPPVESPLLDVEHLRSITAGMTPHQVYETLQQLQASVCNDYQEVYPRIVELCTQQDQKVFAETIHGLKGCFMMTGWTRAGRHCAAALTAARHGTFQGWNAFPSELKELFAQSSEAMSRHLASLAPAEPPKPLPEYNTVETP